MPSVNIDFEKCVENTAKPVTISTPYGLAIIEIQGELNVPVGMPPDHASEEYKANFTKVNDEFSAVKFGQLEFDEKDKTRAVLYIGKSQRLLGNIVSLSTPLGVLRIDSSKKDVKMVDIIYKKIIFKERPLPIMGGVPH